MEKPKDADVLYEAVDGQLSEFMDEYILIGIKAGKKQRMFISNISHQSEDLNLVHAQTLRWARKQDEHDKQY